MYEAASVHRKTAQLAISSGFPNLLIGKYPIISSSVLFPFNFENPSVAYIMPGHIPLTLTPFGPSSTAMCLVRASTPAFAVPACDCNAVPL